MPYASLIGTVSYSIYVREWTKIRAPLKRILKCTMFCNVRIMFARSSVFLSSPRTLRDIFDSELKMLHFQVFGQIQNI